MCKNIYLKKTKIDDIYQLIFHLKTFNGNKFIYFLNFKEF
jgi:hypothetical protein